MKTKRSKGHKKYILNNYLDTCRVCMTKGESMKGLFDSDSKIIEEIEFCTGITISEKPTLPSLICSDCLTKLAIAHDFKTVCIGSDNFFHRLLEDVELAVKSEIVVKEEINAIDDDGDNNYGLCSPNGDFFDDDYLKKVKKKVVKQKRTDERQNNKKQSIHPPTKKLYCSKCDIRFKCRKELVEHVQSCHKEDLYLVCEFCGKQVHCASWTSHNRAHLPPKYNCDKCDYKTVHKGDLVKHARTHTGEKSFQCRHCDSTFRCSSNLVGHIQRRHLGVKNHPCPRCDMAFFSKQKLLRHLDSHDNVKRYECEVCNSSFTRSTHLRHHMKKQHDVTLPRPRPGRRRTELLIEDAPSIFNKLKK